MGILARVVFWLRRLSTALVHAPVDERALGSVGVVAELAINPLEVGQPRAVDVLIEDAGGDEFGDEGGHVNRLASSARDRSG